MVLCNVFTCRLTRQFIIQVTVFVIVLTCRCNRVILYHCSTNCARHILNCTSRKIICLLFIFTGISVSRYTNLELSKNIMRLRNTSLVL